MASQHHVACQRPQQRQYVAAVFLLLFIMVHHAAAAHDVLLPMKPGRYNPSLVVYEGSGWLVARSTELKWDTTGLKWILNRAYLCQVNTTDWSVLSCHDFDPWRGGYGSQCRWGSAQWKVSWEAWGVDDTKLFKWPGRGLWAITGRRPHQPSGSIYCPQPVVWRQWLVQLAPEGQQVDPQLFDYPPQDPANVTWGQKPGGKTDAAGAPAGVLVVGRRLLQRWFSTAAVAAPVEGSSSPSSSSRSSTYPSGRPYRHVHRRHRRKHRYSAAGTIYAGYSTADEDSLIPETKGMTHHYKEHRRPRTRSDATQATDSQQQQQSSASGLPSPLFTASTAALAPDAADQTFVAAAQQVSQAQAGGGAGGSRARVGTHHHDESIPGQPDSWDKYWGHTPVSLAISDGKVVYGHDHSINEKNWMPFVWQGQLYVTYQLAPKHRVYLVHPNGTAQPAYETHTGDAVEGLGSAAARLHGGPPLVYVDYPRYLASVSSPWIQAATVNQGPYYLGVAHYWLPVGGGDGRTYHHFLIKVEAEPPFRLLQVSAELRLQYNQHYKRVAFVSGIDGPWLPAGTPANASSHGSSNQPPHERNLQGTGQADGAAQPRHLLPHILVSYGSGDWESRVMLLTFEDVEALFMQGLHYAGRAVSSSNVTVQGASLPADRGTGYYTMITRTRIPDNHCDNAARLGHKCSKVATEVAEEDPNAGLNHTMLHKLFSQQPADKPSAAVAAALRSGSAEVAAAEAKMLVVSHAQASHDVNGSSGTESGDLDTDLSGLVE